MWNKPDSDWEEDALYGMIRSYQPEAMLINNTGLSKLGKIGNPELDSVTFERGKPTFVDSSDKHRAGEMCQILNDHWAYAENDCNYKSTGELIENLVECRKYNCNFLLNVGLKGNGMFRDIDKAVFGVIGKWMKYNGECIYSVKNSGITLTDEKDFILKSNDGKTLYLIIHELPMSADPNVFQKSTEKSQISFPFNGKIKYMKWLDGGKVIYDQYKNIVSVILAPFPYGKELVVRVVKISGNL